MTKKAKPRAPRTPRNPRFPRLVALSRFLEENRAMRILRWVLMTCLVVGGTALFVATAGEPPSLLTPRATPLSLAPLPALPQPSLFSKLFGNAPDAPDVTQHAGWSYVYDENGSLISEIGTGGPQSSDTIRHIYLPTPNGPMPMR